MFERMLVPLDGSPQAESVLYQAHRLLCGRKGEVVLFHAKDESDASLNPGAVDKYLKGVESRLSPFGARVRRILGTGPFESALAETIRSEKISMVALSSHGRLTASATPVAGAVEKIVRGCEVPVLVTRAFQHDAEGGLVPSKCEPSTIRRILVPMDGSSACVAVMPAARDLALLLNAMVVLLHVSPDYREGSDFVGSRVSGRPTGPMPGKEASSADRLQFAAKTVSTPAAEKVFAAGVETMTLVLGGDPVKTILEFARPSAVDLIAMTTRGRTGLAQRLIGSVAQKVLKETLLPTLLVRASDAQCSV